MGAGKAAVRLKLRKTLPLGPTTYPTHVGV